MTGENFKFLTRNSRIKEIKAKIQELRNEAADVEHQAYVNDNGFYDEELYEKLLRKIEWQEYLLWGEENKIKYS